MWIDERYATRRSFLTRTAFGVGASMTGFSLSDMLFPRVVVVMRIGGRGA